MKTTTKTGRTFLGVAAALALACAGPEGQPGPAGPTGPQGPAGSPGQGFQQGPSLSAVSPGQMVQGRTVEVHVAGFATRWSQGVTPSVNFGPEVTVKSVLVGSDTGLIVTVEAGATAAPGRRNVTVVANGDTLVAVGAFNVQRAFEVVQAPTSVGRPSVATIEIASYDPDLILPKTSAGYGYELPEGMTAGLHSVESARAVFWLTTDLSTQEGGAEVVIKLFPGSDRERQLAVPVTVASEAGPEYGVGDNQSAVPAYGSVAGTFNQETLTILSLQAAVVTGAMPRLYVLDSAGSFDSALVVSEDGTATFLAEPQTTYFLVAWDLTGTESAFTLNVASIPPSTSITESEPNDTFGQANLIYLLPSTVQATLSTSADVDWFKISLPQSAVGKQLVITGYSGGPDLLVAVYGADGTTLIATSHILYYNPSWTGPTITTAGVHYFRMYESSSYSGSFSLQLSLQ